MVKAEKLVRRLCFLRFRVFEQTRQPSNSRRTRGAGFQNLKVGRTGDYAGGTKSIPEVASLLPAGELEPACLQGVLRAPGGLAGHPHPGSVNAYSVGQAGMGTNLDPGLPASR